MARVKGSTPTRNRRKRILKAASGYFGSKHLLYRTAHEQVMHSWKYSYIDRKKLKREMRKLWIARINAAARINGMSYSKLMHGLKIANVAMNRKMLSEVAIHDEKSFAEICDVAKDALVNGPKKEEVPAEKPVKKAAAKKAEEAPAEEAKPKRTRKTTKKEAE